MRFPEFSGEWKKCIIQDYGEVITGNTPPTNNAEYYNNGSYLWASPADLGTGKKINDTKTKLSESGFKKTRIIPKGSILVTCIGSTIGKIGMAVETMSSNQQINSIIVNEKSNNDFVYYAISRAFPRYLSEVGVQAVPILSKSNFEKLPNYTTSIEEQDKTGYFLNLLDERIATQNKIIEDLKKLKCAIIEKLYSKIQGKEYSYGQLFDVVNERNKQMEYYNILSASQEKGMVNRDDLNLDIQFERSNINTYKIVRKGDYVIHLRSFQGGFAFSDKLGVCSPAYTILRPNSLLEYSYLSYYFTSQRFIKSLIIVTYGIRDGRSINVEEWLNMKVVIPSKEHQLHTLNVLKRIDDKVENEEKYATCLSNQKQYLLRQMFI
ncbi:restriction endonuclease subunit S [Barnesiella intestinihominis]|uniref:restriction endonuclease subunit S n=1 Tax=Barnesiella intestinihominis TaxID=487174 RepID=UPI0022DE9C4D|nr:restriction endonuclease subunit S [Barnesiella intestinihominis]